MKKMAAVVGLSVFCATAFAAAQPKKIRESCEQECKGNCSHNFSGILLCHGECEIKCRHQRESHAAPRERTKSGRSR
jgi:hypothetical protein